MLSIQHALLLDSQMAKACDYAPRIWERLEVFLSRRAMEGKRHAEHRCLSGS
jgi:hypothetical protein